MPKNLLKRIVTSFFLFSILLIVNFSHQLIFILSILILGVIVCVEANNMFSKLIVSNFSQPRGITKNLNFKFMILNIIIFCYVFFSDKFRSLFNFFEKFLIPTIFNFISCL